MKFFSRPSQYKNKHFKELRDSYTSWREEVQAMNKPFFAIHSDFQELFLKDLSGPAFKLYVFLGLNSKYYTGESWFSSKEISDFFRKDQRTVANWFKELEDRGLIVREQKGFKMKANTFLRPYGFTVEEIMSWDRTTTVDNVMNDVETSQDLGRQIVHGVMLSYSLKEYTFVLISKMDNRYFCSCFPNFPVDELRDLRFHLKKFNATVDVYDIDAPISSSRQKKSTIYQHILNYLREEDL